MGGNRQKDFKSRTLSITDEMWDQAKKRQKQLGMASISDYIRHLIRVDVEKKGDLIIFSDPIKTNDSADFSKLSSVIGTKALADMQDTITREILKRARSTDKNDDASPPADDEDNGKEASG